MQIDFNNSIFDNVRCQDVFNKYVKMMDFCHSANFEENQFWSDEALTYRDEIYNSFDKYDWLWLRTEVYPLISKYKHLEWSGIDYGS